MNMVGRAVSTFGKRMLILRCDAAQVPGMYSDVVDRKLLPVGKIVDIFGSVKAPYAVVACKDHCQVQPNEKLYAKETGLQGRERRVLKQRTAWKIG